MGTMTPEELLRRWSGENLSADMAIGHVLQHLVKLHTTVESLNRTISKLRAELDTHPSHNGIKPLEPQKARPNER
jgi:hypothetical protein